MAEKNNGWRDSGGEVYTPQTPPGTETKARASLQTDVDLVTHVISDNDTRVRKVLGQVAPAATTLTTLYTAPADTSTEVSTIYIAETAGNPAVFRISIQVAAAANNVKQYLFYDAPLIANETIQLNECGIMLQPTDVLKVYSDTGAVSFSAFGTQIT